MTLDHLLLFVPDLVAARAFYGGVLRFPVRAEGDTHLVFAVGDRDLVVFRGDAPTRVGRYAQEARAVFVFAVPSIETAMRDLGAAGVPFLHEEPARGPLGLYAAFVDPFGIVHELQERHAP